MNSKKKKIFILFACIVLFSCNNQIDKNKTKQTVRDTINKVTTPFQKESWTIARYYNECPYYFDTILKNNYHLHFEYFIGCAEFGIESQLTLMKENKTIDTLNSMSAGLPLKNLGYIGADFKEYFAFVQSFGSGNPHEMQLLRKIDASKIVEGFIVDADEKNGLLLYCRGYDSLMLFDINRKTNKLIVNLESCDYITCMVSQLCGNLKIKKVTSKQVEIEIAQDENKTIRKKYYR